MNVKKIVYWLSTAIVALSMAFSCYAYLTKPEIAAGFKHLGFPGYFRVELGIGKLLGAILLLAPVPARVKEWTYAALGITFISAFIAHSASGDPFANAAMPLIFLALLVVSYATRYQHKAGVPAL